MTINSKNNYTARRRVILIFSTYALRFAGQGISFFLFARALGAEKFGFVVAALAIFSPISPLVDMGAYSIVSRDIALGRHPPDVISENLTTMIVTLPLALAGALLFSHITNPQLNLLTTFLIGLAYLLISRTSLLLAAIQNTIDARIPVIAIEGISAALLIALGIIGLFYPYHLVEWATAYASVGIFITFLSLILIRRYIGDFVMNKWPNLQRLKEGLTFSFGSTFQYIYTDIDKVILLKFSTATLTGVFGMSSRISTLSLIPIGAFYSLYYPRFMKSGHGIDIPIYKLLLKVLTMSTVYSIFLFVLFKIFSPLIPFLLGSSYSQVPWLLNTLIFSIIFQVFQTPFADAITGMGHQIYRTCIQAFICIIALCAGLTLIPGQAVLGAVRMNIIIHGTLLFLYIFFYFYLSRRKLR